VLQPLPGLPQFAGHTLPHGDHEGGREEDADLAELDLFGLVVVTRGAQNDQPDILPIQLSLRAQMNILRILDR
jgi:hypothetical protein